MNDVGDHVGDPQHVKRCPGQLVVDEEQRDQGRRRQTIMNTGSSSSAEPEQPEADAAQPVTGLRPEPRRRNRRVTWMLPRAQRSRCFHSAAMLTWLLGPHGGVRLEDDPPPRPLGLERGDRVLGQRGGVDPAADRLDVGPRVQLRAAGQAGEHAEHVLAPPGRRLGGDVLVADEPGQVVARAAALLDVGGDRADLRIGQMAGHPAQRVRLVDHVRVHDQDRLHPVVAPGSPPGRG